MCSRTRGLVHVRVCGPPLHLGRGVGWQRGRTRARYSRGRWALPHRHDRHEREREDAENGENSYQPALRPDTVGELAADVLTGHSDDEQTDVDVIAGRDSLEVGRERDIADRGKTVKDFRQVGEHSAIVEPFDGDDGEDDGECAREQHPRVRQEFAQRQGVVCLGVRLAFCGGRIEVGLEPVRGRDEARNREDRGDELPLIDEEQQRRRGERAEGDTGVAGDPVPGEDGPALLDAGANECKSGGGWYTQR